ncbi:MAG: aminotransferase class I/II-fold pyridoxal phosphate-dependent enzyme [Deltaproteobacteria bacterium]|nr:aminotransferase class I/II-fold pyridoxal phosphate-dependent enzyme [Deltaproteobacteria bacterium]
MSQSASEWLASGLAPMASALEGTQNLAIAEQVRSLVAAGKTVCTLTIGDFEPAHYPLPKQLLEGTAQAMRDGWTNYPPSTGIAELRTAVLGLCERRRGWRPALESVLVAGGARPVLYACYLALLDRGDKVVFATPSWNNNHYAHMVGARAVELPVGPEDNFFPDFAHIRPHLGDARLIVLNSPLNPSGTCIDRGALLQLCQAIVAENERRKAAQQRPLFLCYDQIYWMLTFGQTRHVDPVGVLPAMADYTIYVDGISKCFAATGLRVGWTVAPPPVADAMNKLLGHIGAWAPKAEQRAAAELLRDDVAIDSYLTFIRAAAGERLTLLHARLTALAERGYPIRALVPQGAIYLSAEFALVGWRDGGRVLADADQVRAWLLGEVGIATVPFAVFGAQHAEHWHRLSVGAVGVQELGDALDRLEVALGRLQPA